ncbi:hypothetical protein AALP_AAs55697U000300 [Arabis alpina]|uniref:EF-hand domain-containing protein n=1 Tax=Arabis alpina TaxID=50452 RepID=A0A087G3I5_ARAAL|nr:hypothetical protein AALP_AAs55697U000300 [Arabis alpina]
MSGLTILDGAVLRSIDLNLPELAFFKFLNLSLPPHLTEAAISRVTAGDDVSFRLTELNPQQASEKLGVFVSAVADAIRDAPVVVLVLDGSTLKLFLEDEDDFAMLAENLFTDLDEEDKGKLCKSHIRTALSHMGVPPLSDDIIKSHDADGDELLGQAQFAQLLQPVVQDIADILHHKPIPIVLNLDIFTGSRLRNILADEKKLNCILEKMMLQVSNDQGWAHLIKTLIENNGKELGLPPLSSDNEPVLLLYETIFSQLNNREKETTGPGFIDALKDILAKFEELLEATPVYCATNL